MKNVIIISKEISYSNILKSSVYEQLQERGINKKSLKYNFCFYKFNWKSITADKKSGFIC